MSFNLLIVDDSLTVRAFIKKALRLAEIPINDLFEAENGKEALEILGENWVDLVFVDINMPVMGGIEMIDKLNEDGLMQTLPVVVVSTEGSATRIKDLESKGVRAYIRKPFQPEQFREIIKDILGLPNAN